MGEKMNDKVFFPAKGGIFCLINNIIEVLFPTCTLTWRMNNYVSHQVRGVNKKNEITNIIIKIVQLIFCYCQNIFAVNLETYFPSQRREQLFVEK